MKIEDLNKENALSVKNNLGVKSQYFDPQKDIIDFLNFDFQEFLVAKSFKIFVNEKWGDTFGIADLRNNLLQWFNVYDYLGYYETKYEYVFMGHDYNYHIDKQNGDLDTYEIR